MTFKNLKVMIKCDYELIQLRGKIVNNTNLAYSYQDYEWNLPEWTYIAEEMSKVFRFTTEERYQFENSNTAKFIATIPFEAGCEEPERTAIAHLCIYVAEQRGFQKYYAHLPSDDEDVFNRLSRILTFKGGNSEIINHGMNVLALIMIEGYRRSMKCDKENNIYNPLVSGNWNYQLIKNKLIWEINKKVIPNLDWILSNNSLGIW